HAALAVVAQVRSASAGTAAAGVVTGRYLVGSTGCRSDRAIDPRHGPVGVAFFVVGAGRHATAAHERLDDIGTLPPRHRAVRFFLRQPASVDLSGAGPGRLLDTDSRRHREAALHHGGIHRLVRAAGAGAHLDARHDAQVGTTLGATASH